MDRGAWGATVHGATKSRALLLLLSCFSRVRLCDPTDGSPPGSAVPGILQARTLLSNQTATSKLKGKKYTCHYVETTRCIIQKPYGLHQKKKKKPVRTDR